MQKYSTPKQRILQYAKEQGLSERQMCEKAGIGRGTFGNKLGISEKTLSKIFDIFPNLNKIWVYEGTGEMENKIIYPNKEEQDPQQINEPVAHYSDSVMVNFLSRKIIEIEERLSELEKKCKFMGKNEER